MFASNYQWLLVCLGNPGRDYENTRHNIGFMAADRLSSREGTRFSKLRYRALTGEIRVGSQRVLVIQGRGEIPCVVGARQDGGMPDKVGVAAKQLTLDGERVNIAGRRGTGLQGERVDLDGEVYVNGEKVSIHSPCDAVRCGISYLSEDRKQQGLIIEMPVEDNITIAALGKLKKFFGFVDFGKCRGKAGEYAEMLKIRTPSLQSAVKSLSGGNQQKTVVAKWLLRDTDILIFDEPTRGIDIGAKDEICELLLRLADMGKAVIMISSEMQEIMRVCDRILVMHEGEITGELDAEEATQEDIMRLASRIEGENI